MIQFNDVLASYLELKSEIDDAVSAVINRAAFINGSEVAAFEQNFAAFSGSEYCVGTSSGTSALHAMMLAAGIKPGDEVITSSMTFIASSEAISQCGATPIFSDVDPGTLNISRQTVIPRISSKTKAVLFVHLHGNSEGILDIEALCKEHNLLLFEDCAQAHGGVCADGRKVGTVGVASAFSFFPAKNLGAFGDAGAVCTNDQAIAEKTRSLINHGRQEKYLHLVEGFNARLDTLQAAVLNAKLKNLEKHCALRAALAAFYKDELKNLPITFQKISSSAVHAWHLFAVSTDHRDALQKHLTAEGIQTGIHYPIPLHKQPAYNPLNLSLPHSEHTAATTLSLPFYPQLPKEHAQKVADAVKTFFNTL